MVAAQRLRSSTKAPASQRVANCFDVAAAACSWAGVTGTSSSFGPEGEAVTTGAAASGSASGTEGGAEGCSLVVLVDSASGAASALRVMPTTSGLTTRTVRQTPA